MTSEEIRARMLPCPHCEAGKLQYQINTGNFHCDRCYRDIPWTVELDRAFCKATQH
jgi:uncharacterized protein (DUF983 family)